MSKKISLGVAVAAVILCVTATFAVTMTVSQRLYNRLISDISGRFQLYSGIDKIDEIVKNKYYGTVDSNELNDGIYQGYISSLDSCRYLTSDEYVVYDSTMKGERGNIGIKTQYNPGENALTVTRVYDGSPAAAAGLRVGDLINLINSTEIQSDNYEQLLEQLQGSTLSTVSIGFKRNRTQMQESVSLGYAARSVTYSVNGSVGYINISAFYANTAEQFRTALEKVFGTGGVNGLIIDVRNTSEGSVEYATNVLDVIVPLMDYPLAAAKLQNGDTVKDENNADVYSYPAEKSSITVPKKITVLVNAKTSGGGELLASALTDYDATKSVTAVIGETTAGNTKMQKPFRLEDGNVILVTVASLVSGKSEIPIDGAGVVPNYPVPLGSGQQIAESIAGDITADDQLKAAYAASVVSETGA